MIWFSSLIQPHRRLIKFYWQPLQTNISIRIIVVAVMVQQTIDLATCSVKIEIRFNVNIRKITLWNIVLEVWVRNRLIWHWTVELCGKSLLVKLYDILLLEYWMLESFLNCSKFKFIALGKKQFDKWQFSANVTYLKNRK